METESIYTIIETTTHLERFGATSLTTGDEDVYDYSISNYEYPHEFKSVPTWEAGFKITFYVIITIVALIGNFLVILVVAKNQRMRTTTNFYLVNLAICDLLVTISCTWVHVLDDLTEGWVLGQFLCKYVTFAQVVSLVASVLTLTLIACDRFFGIVFALKARITERKAIPFLLLVWAVSIVVSTPILVFRTQLDRKWQNHLEVWCEGEWPGDALTYRKVYYTTISLVLFIIPILVMTVAYSLVIWRLWTSHLPGEQVESEVSAQAKVKRKVIIMLIVILALFVVCWLPFVVTVLYAEYRDKQHKLPEHYFKFQFFAKFMSFANSAINPIIYAGFNENFKKGFKELLKMKKPRRETSIDLRRDSYHSNSYQSHSHTMISKV